MPEKLIKNKDGSYKVVGPHGTHAKHTSKKKAEAQIRIIEQADAKKRGKK